MTRSRRIDQVLPSFALKDAIGIDNRSIRDLLREKGFQSDIFCEEGATDGESRNLSEYVYDHPNNIVIHHFSIGSSLPYRFIDSCSLVVTRYHNITPDYFFPFEHTRHARSKCVEGRSQMSLVRDHCDFYWAVSKFNESELLKNHFKKGSVLPLMRNHEKLLVLDPCSVTSKALDQDMRKTLLFVGRVVPNKAQHDLIFMLKQFKMTVDSEVKLICVGGIDPFYGQKMLGDLCDELGLSYRFGRNDPEGVDVLFTGSVSTRELVSFYRGADAFVCFSDHEGFCVPLVEAMNFSIPILAHRAGAVPETLGCSGRLVDKRDLVSAIKTLCEILYSEVEISRQKELNKERVKDFSWLTLRQEFYRQLDSLLCLDRNARDFCDLECDVSTSDTFLSPSASNSSHRHRPFL